MKLIVEMEMPKSCDACPLLDESGDYPMCRATQETRGYNFDTRNKKMDKCPIVSVLPDEHGDLIDRNALIKSVNGVSTHWLNDWSTLGVLSMIDKQPTVIAAERKDDGN